MNTDEHENNAVYVEHLRTEHRHLDRETAVILKLLVDSCEQQRLFDSTAVAAAMSDLQQSLEEHFRVEEEGGCLEQAYSRCPGLLQEARHIESEHGPLLGELDELVVQTRLAESKPQQDDVHERFRAFVQDLRMHEAAENRLLATAFGLEAD